MAAPLSNFADEAQSAYAFDALADSTGLFNTYKEVKGTLLQPRPAQRDRGVRIDRILVPTNTFLSAGWTGGIIGVEIKRDAEAIGPYLAQAMDYSRSAFTLPNSGFQIILDWVFVWPIPKQHGPVASLMAQNRIGNVSNDTWCKLQFCAGETNILRINNDNTVRIGRQSVGTKVGSR